MERVCFAYYCLLQLPAKARRLMLTALLSRVVELWEQEGDENENSTTKAMHCFYWYEPMHIFNSFMQFFPALLHHHHALLFAANTMSEYTCMGVDVG